MKLKLKINVEPLWTVGVRPLGSTDEFDFRNQKDIGMVHVDKIKNSLHCDLSDAIIKENTPYLVAFALDDKINGFRITNVESTNKWTGDCLEINCDIDFEWRGIFNPLKQVNEDELRQFIVQWLSNEALYLFDYDGSGVISDDTYDYWIDVATSPFRVKIEHELKR